MTQACSIRQAYQTALWAFIDRAERQPLAQALEALAGSSKFSPEFRRLLTLAHMVLSKLPPGVAVADWAGLFGRIDRLLSIALSDDPSLSDDSFDYQAKRLIQQFLNKELFQTAALVPDDESTAKDPAPMDPAWIARGHGPQEGWMLVVELYGGQHLAVPAEHINGVTLSDGWLKPQTPLETSPSDETIHRLGQITWQGQTLPLVALASIDSSHTLAHHFILVIEPHQEAETTRQAFGLWTVGVPQWLRHHEIDLGTHIQLDWQRLAQAMAQTG